MVHNIAAVVPAGAPTALAAKRTPANWLLFTAPTGNAAAIRIGDLTTDATHGLILPAGATILFPPISDDLYLDLALIYVYGTTTDSITALYGTH